MAGHENKPSQAERLIRSAAKWLRVAKETLWPPLWTAIAAGIRIGYRDIVTTSSHLSYLTMFGLVPFLVLALAVMKPLGLLGNTHQALHHFLVNTGIATIHLPVKAGPEETQEEETPQTQPSATVDLATELERIVSQVLQRLTVERVGPVGVLVLAWAAISLITTLEKALNRIFGAQTRPIGQRFLLYWSVATLVPITIAAVVFAARRAISHVEELSLISYVVGAFAYIAPTLVGILIVAMLYKYLPNTYVDLRSSMVGATAAVPIWVVAKHGFQLYLGHIVVSGSLYGVLGLIPVFLLWLNMSWLIFLWGAQLTHAYEHGGRVWIEMPGDVSLRPQPSDLLAVALVVARYFQAGLGAISVPEIGRNITLPQGNIRELLRYLEANRIVLRQADTRQPRYLLARPPDKIRVLEAFGLDVRQDVESLADRYNTRTAVAIFRAQDRALSNLGEYTLENLLADERSANQRKESG